MRRCGMASQDCSMRTLLSSSGVTPAGSPETMYCTSSRSWRAAGLSNRGSSLHKSVRALLMCAHGTRPPMDDHERARPR
eukprot:3081240-Amphidinium_carterae.1